MGSKNGVSSIFDLLNRVVIEPKIELTPFFAKFKEVKL